MVKPRGFIRIIVKTSDHWLWRTKAEMYEDVMEYQAEEINDLECELEDQQADHELELAWLHRVGMFQGALLGMALMVVAYGLGRWL